jgi:hypothetical protein
MRLKQWPKNKTFQVEKENLEGYFMKRKKLHKEELTSSGWS